MPAARLVFRLVCHLVAYSRSLGRVATNPSSKLIIALTQLDVVQADGRAGAEQGPQTAGKHGPHEREMASTLAALAAAAPPSGEHPGYPPLFPVFTLCMLTKGSSGTSKASGAEALYSAQQPKLGECWRLYCRVSGVSAHG